MEISYESVSFVGVMWGRQREVDCFYVCDESVVILCGRAVFGTLDPSSLTASSSPSPSLVILVQDRDRFCE
jgi:hypothetical protein